MEDDGSAHGMRGKRSILQTSTNNPNFRLPESKSDPQRGKREIEKDRRHRTPVQRKMQLIAKKREKYEKKKPAASRFRGKKS